MKLLLPPRIAEELISALRIVGSREIGGILMGEHLDKDLFRITEITVQKRGGTFSFFVRLVEGFTGSLKAFFHRTNHRYTKFNYLGEWHSHHSFSLRPSGQDQTTMLELVNDPDLGANFVVLMLVKFDRDLLKGSLTIYRPHMAPYLGELVQE